MRGLFTKLLLLLLLVILGCLAFLMQGPPGIKPASSAAQDFSAERAYLHLQEIAQRPHSSGTSEHGRVRNYIADYCRSMGLMVHIQDTLGWRSYGNTTVASHVKNIVAKFPGTSSGRDILVVSHYDSQPNTPGASDDGAGVSAMLETVRALKNSQPLQNDIIFLFTDQEESGLLGAEAFASLHPDMQEVEVVLNYESRGNRGVALCFEVSDSNGWMVRQFARAAARPVANSLAYEIYKLMPNDTDFTIFRERGITGINQANVDGFVSYHSMTDTPELIDLGIVQHHGDNMISMLKHLGRLELKDTKSPDINFFNPWGSLLLFYPGGWNLPLIIVCIILFIYNFVYGTKKGLVGIKNLLIGSLVFIISMVCTITAAFFLSRLVVWFNPHFSNFYANNFYNVHWYGMALVGLWLAINSLLYRKLWKITGGPSLALGAALIMVLALIMLQYKLSTASFALYYPLIWFLAFHLVVMKVNPKQPGYLVVLPSLAALGLWVPLAVNLFLVFSLQVPQAAMALLGLCWGIMVPAFCLVEDLKFSPILLLGLILLVTGLSVGQLKARFDKDQPLQTGITYVANRDTRQAVWVSFNEFKDPWSAQYLNHPQQEPFSEFNSQWQVWKGDIHYLEIPESSWEVESDSTADGIRSLTLKLLPGRNVLGMELWFEPSQPLSSLIVEGRPLPIYTRRLNIVAIDQQARVSLSMESDDIKFKLVERSLGIPQDLLPYPMSEEYIFGPGVFNNAVLTSRQIVL